MNKRTTDVVAPSGAPLDIPRPRLTGRLHGVDSSDIELPVLHLFQDVGKESESYGEHDKGAWVNSQTQEEVDAEGKLIVPVIGWKCIEAWWKRESGKGGFIGRYRSRMDVPNDIADDPDVELTSVISYIVLLEGQPEVPLIMRFSATHHRVGRALATMEEGRAALGKPVGAYRLDKRQASNEKGRWFIPVLKPSGDAPEEVARYADAYAKSLSILVDHGAVRSHGYEAGDVQAAPDDDRPAPDEEVPF